MRRFKSDADVAEYFSLQAELGPTPEPPADLWGRMERTRRAESKVRARKSYPLTEPNLISLEFPEIAHEQKLHPIKLDERHCAVPDVHLPRRKIYKLNGSPAFD